MPFALLLIGLLLVTAAIRGSQDELVSLLYAEFSGQGNFLYWIIALVLVGAVGYVPKLKGFSDALLVLIIVSLFLSKGKGFFPQFANAITTPTIN